jgi:hypothetical protein
VKTTEKEESVLKIESNKSDSGDESAEQQLKTFESIKIEKPP